MDLRSRADWVRQELISLNLRAPETRVSSSLSSVEIFVALYYDVLRFDASKPLDESRDRCIISKGHGSICLYPILADLGFFPKDELNRVCKEGGILGGIPDPIIPGYETINGSLGHGLGVGAGISLALKWKESSSKVYVVVGDGELHEGSCWEAIMFASQWKLNNLTVIIDNNGQCMLGHTDAIVSHCGFKKRFEAFGWKAISVNDGHDVDELAMVFNQAQSETDLRPKVIVCPTLKGKGVQSLEGKKLTHVMGIPNDEAELLLRKHDA